jgi:hypothetical protein
MSVIIGVDPHKARHTAVAIDRNESEVARARVRATRKHESRPDDAGLGWRGRRRVRPVGAGHLSVAASASSRGVAWSPRRVA